MSPYSDSERNTYIFFAPIYVRHPPKSKHEWNFILGSASFKAHSNILYSKGKYSNNQEFSNAVVIFKDGISYGFLETYAHELGHALGLTHTFESNGMFKFHQGYTDNLMDYAQSENNIISKYNGKLNILSKYQIDMIRHNSRIGGVLWPWKWTY
ncbi:M43 family zinc metalloprotease [Acinetobacter sp. Root1280]|uniref:M43 family zinc metalloprotease n=1 Tax=Acinetobacter sp. Root1280 TaxID=1736444 RepID=UPI0029DE5E96|nr:M43 family zinc metalloprotease [Acinetobacter sp. Root1280]